LATHTHKPVDQFIKEHQAGKTWAELATANNEDLNTIDQKLTRIEQAMKNPGAAASTSNEERTRVRERGEAAKSELDKRVEALNAYKDKPVATRAGFAALSKETAVPYPTIQEVQQQHENVALGDLAIAQELAVHTQKSVDELLKQHTDGKTWSEIVAANNQDVASIQKKLANVEQAAREAGK